MMSHVFFSFILCFGILGEAGVQERKTPIIIDHRSKDSKKWRAKVSETPILIFLFGSE